MGQIYRPAYIDRHGVKQTSAVYWVRYRQHGKTVRQSTETTSEAKARTFLREREGKVALHIPVIPKAERLTLGEAADLVRHDYVANDRKSGAILELQGGAAGHAEAARQGDRQPRDLDLGTDGHARPPSVRTHRALPRGETGGTEHPHRVFR